MSLGQPPEKAIGCTINVIGLYLNIPHEEQLTSLKRFSDMQGWRKK